MGGGVDAAHVLEIVIGAGADGGFTVALTEDLPATALSVREEGRLFVDEAALRTCATAREYGIKLGEALFTGATLAAWQRARARGRERLHVIVEALAPEARTLRWDRLCAPFEGGSATTGSWDFLRCDQRTPFTLRVASQSDRTYAPPREPRALVLVTSPSDLEDYGLEKFDTLATIAGVSAALAPWPVDVLAFSVPGAVGPPTLEGLCEQLTARAYTAVHVVCHGAYARGGGEVVLYLADDDETTAPAPASKLLRRLGRLGGDVGLPLLWFLAACESAAPEAEGALGGLSARLGRELGAPAVVAMSERVSIDTAGALVRPFYRQMRAHALVDLALAEACSAVAERADVVVPVLHARAAGVPLWPAAGPTGQVAKDMAPETGARVLSETPLPLSLGARFVGRAAVVEELGARLTATPDRPPALALVAPGGLGKTRVALELIGGHRAAFPGGVLWLDASAPARVEAVQHALLRQLRPDTPSLADLQGRGAAVGPLLAEAARTHAAGRLQLWVLDHVPESAAGEAAAVLATLCPRWGEVAVLVTSRMRPDEAGLEVVEIEGLSEGAGSALLTAGLPAGAMAEADAAAVVRWVGGMPLALELLARSLDLGDLSPADLREQARGGGVARALTETQQVLRTAGAGAGLSPLVDSLRLSYTRLSPEAQALARRIAQFGPEPLPTALVKALGPVASRLARATLAARSFVTGISGQMFGSMHRVLADFLRGLGGADEPAEAAAALLRTLPKIELGEPARWPALVAVAVHAEALVLRTTAATPVLTELANVVGLLYQQQSRVREAGRIQRIALAFAEACLPPEDQQRIVAVNNLAMTMTAEGEPQAALALQHALTQAVTARNGPDDPLALVLAGNFAVALQGLGQTEAAHALLLDVVARRERLGDDDSADLLSARLSLAAAKSARGELAAARALQERVHATWLARGGQRAASTLIAAKGLGQTLVLQGELAAARRVIEPALAAAREVWPPDHQGLIELREVLVAILGDEGSWAEARAEQDGIVGELTRSYGPEHPRTLHAKSVLGRLLYELGSFAEARALQASTLATVVRRYGPLHPTARALVENMVETHDALGEPERAHALLAGLLAGLRAALGPDHREVLMLEPRLALLLGRMRRFAEAEALLQRVHGVLTATGGPRGEAALTIVDRMATLALWAGDLARAREIQAAVLEDSRASLGAEHVDTLLRTVRLGETLVWLQASAEGCGLIREAHAKLTQALGAEHLEVLSAGAELGIGCLSLGALDEAEARMTAGLAALTKRLPANHGGLLRLRIGLVRLRRLQGRLDEAAARIAEVVPLLVMEHAAVFTEGAFVAADIACALHTAGRGAEGLPLLRRAVEMATVAVGADHATLLAYKLNLATLVARVGGDVAAARAIVAEVAASVARTGGSAHPLAASLGAYEAKYGR